MDDKYNTSMVVELAQRAFVIDKQMQGLVLAGKLAGKLDTQNTPDRLSMQAVVDCVLSPLTASSMQTRKVVNSDLRYVAWYKLVLDSLCLMQSASQASASSAILLTQETDEYTRRGEGFVLLLKPMLGASEEQGINQFRYTPENTPENTPESTPENTPENNAKDNPKDIKRDTSKDAKKDIKKNKQTRIVLQLDSEHTNRIGDAHANMYFLHCQYNMQIYMVALTRVKDNQFHAVLSTNDERLFALVNEESHLYVS